MSALRLRCRRHEMILSERPESPHVSRFRDRLRHVRSFDTKSAPRMSRKPCDLELPNFTWTSIPPFSTVTPVMASLTTSRWKLSEKTVQNTATNGFGWNFARMVKQRSRSLTHLSRTIGPTTTPGMTSLTYSGRPQNVTKYHTTVRKLGPTGQRSE